MLVSFRIVSDKELAARRQMAFMATLETRCASFEARRETEEAARAEVLRLAKEHAIKYLHSYAALWLATFGRDVQIWRLR